MAIYPLPVGSLSGVEGEKLYLLPVCRALIRSGTGTCSRTRRFGLTHEPRKRNSGQRQSPTPKAVKSVVEKFREKYGAEDVKKYYSGLDVAVVVHMT